MRALGTIIETNGAPLGETEFYSTILDYYDRWATIDDRLKEHWNHLSRASHIFGHDLVNIAQRTHMRFLVGFHPSE
jgi:hypothetical protein